MLSFSATRCGDRRHSGILSQLCSPSNANTSVRGTFAGLKPGAYRIQAALYGWREQDFNNAERSELASMGAPFLGGDVPASISIKLIP
jgi:hypothetical protein